MCLATWCPAGGAVLEVEEPLRGGALLEEVVLWFYIPALFSACSVLPDCGCDVTNYICHGTAFTILSVIQLMARAPLHAKPKYILLPSSCFLSTVSSPLIFSLVVLNPRDQGMHPRLHSSIKAPGKGITRLPYPRSAVTLPDRAQVLALDWFIPYNPKQHTNAPTLR